MKRKFLLLLIAAIAPVFSFAQGCITVFSEDGDKFFLVLNGIQQNNVAQTNVHVDGLPNEFYSAKIMFEDAGKPAISKNIPTKDAGTNQFADVTYKIKRTKDGELKLRYFGATPVPVNYNPPPDMFVVHYGQPIAPAVSSVSQTTQTTTVTNANPANANLSVNGGGVNMNINVSDPTNGGGVNMSVNLGDANMNMNTNVTQSTVTRTTTTTTTSSNDGYNNTPPPPARTGCSYPMDFSSFSSAKKTISGSSFEDTKFSTAKSILSANCVSTDQVMEICNLFSHEQTKLDFAKYAYSKTTDPANYFKVGNVFTFDASKTELNEFISK